MQVYARGSNNFGTGEDTVFVFPVDVFVKPEQYNGNADAIFDRPVCRIIFLDCLLDLHVRVGQTGFGVLILQGAQLYSGGIYTVDCCK